MLNQIKELYKQAMLNKNEDGKRVYNNLIAQCKNKEIELRAKDKPLTNEDITSLIQKTIKQDLEANEMFKQGNREDLIANNNKEIELLQGLLPKQLSNEELETAIKSIITEVQATSLKDMGKVMGKIKTDYAGKVDMSVVSTKIKQLLGA